RYAELRKTEFIQRPGRVDVIEVPQALKEPAEDLITLPGPNHTLKFFTCHAYDLGEVLEVVATPRHGLVQGLEISGERSSGTLRCDLERGQSTRKGDDLLGCETCASSSRSNLSHEGEDLFLSRIRVDT